MVSSWDVYNATVKQVNGLLAEKLALQEQINGLAEERDALRFELDDWKNIYREVISEMCPSDEKHCSCVPFLRIRIDALLKAMKAFSQAHHYVNGEDCDAHVDPRDWYLFDCSINYSDVIELVV